MTNTTDQASSPPEGEQRQRRSNFFDSLKSLLGFRSHLTLRNDLEDVLSSTKDENPAFTPQEKAMLSNILNLRTVRIADVMVPRADIVAVDHAIAVGDLLKLFREAAHSRLPVYRETLDDPIGMVHIRDLLDYLMTGAPRKNERRSSPREAADIDFSRVDMTSELSAARIIRPVLFVPPSMPAMDLLVKMQATRVHMALVIDEYGGTDGLVSIEDLIEEVVGEIEDEHDEDEIAIQTVKDGWIAVARAALEDVREAIGADFRPEDFEELAEEVDTLGGMITALLGRVPARGEIIRDPTQTFEFDILDADPRRIKRVRIRRATQDIKLKKTSADSPQKLVASGE